MNELGIAFLIGTIVASLPSSEFADTEATTNIPFVVIEDRKPGYVLEMR